MFEWLAQNPAAAQAIATIVLVVVTTVYATFAYISAHAAKRSVRRADIRIVPSVDRRSMAQILLVNAGEAPATDVRLDIELQSKERAEYQRRIPFYAPMLVPGEVYEYALQLPDSVNEWLNEEAEQNDRTRLIAELNSKQAQAIDSLEVHGHYEDAPGHGRQRIKRRQRRIDRPFAARHPDRHGWHAAQTTAQAEAQHQAWWVKMQLGSR